MYVHVHASTPVGVQLFVAVCLCSKMRHGDLECNNSPVRLLTAHVLLTRVEARGRREPQSEPAGVTSGKSAVTGVLPGGDCGCQVTLSAAPPATRPLRHLTSVITF